MALSGDRSFQIVDSNEDTESKLRLLTDGPGHDIVLIVGKKREPIKAHKVMLMTKCPAFRFLGSQEGGNAPGNGLIEQSFPDIEPAGFRKILEYLYCGKLELSMPVAVMLDILKGAKILGIDDLARNIESNVLRMIGKDNMMPEEVVSAFDWAYRERYSVIIAECMKQFDTDATLMGAGNFSTLSNEAFASILSSRSITVTEDVVYKCCENWLNKNKGVTDEVKHGMIQRIRFHLIQNGVLVDHQANGKITPAEFCMIFARKEQLSFALKREVAVRSLKRSEEQADSARAPTFDPQVMVRALGYRPY